MSPVPITDTVSTRFSRFERLAKVSCSLSRFSELEPLLQTAVEVALELTLSESSSISIFEEETGLLKFVAAPRPAWDTLKRMRIPLENSIAGRCFTQSEPVIVQSDCEDERVYRAVDQALEFRTCSLLAVPLIHGKQTIGVMEAVNKRDNSHYTEEDVTILETLASQAATAIQFTHLLENAQLAYADLAEIDRKKSNFVAVTSQELRTPLGLILGHATVLKEYLDKPNQLRQVEVILLSAARLKKIVEDLDNIEQSCKSKSGINSRKFRLDQVIQEVVESFQVSAQQKNVLLSDELPPESLIMYGDLEKIAIALSNLISNAITYTNENGRVEVITESLPGYARISVKDDGIGIPAEDLPHVFERFYQVESHRSRKQSGIGLGLSIAKVMVEMHGGQIWAESVEGQGSSFTFLLPI